MDRQNFTVTNCMVICCEGKHNIEFKDGQAIIPLQELFNIEKCCKNFFEKLCGAVC